ncbi:hypothetical protein L211DRAFT_866383 [Terfezia boudieri ATCC MYA-4762]|uniref:Uncharacterized protein n=1 Tax=Terfezia boudieri ATCC MYA-4762 TaxID=1051890 RepID=A0A3N4LXZ9_9PEZI|nr:hypothetical protein L211DRAFT_866383 [Terfezia boudieri ATCC MYA-4762]
MLNHSIKGHRYVGLLGKLSRRRVNTQQGEMHSYVRTQQGFMVVYGIAGVSMPQLVAIWQLQEQFQTKLDGKLTKFKDELKHELIPELIHELKYEFKYELKAAEARAENFLQI